MKLILLFVTLLLSNPSYSQSDFNTVDRKLIEKLVTDSSLQTFYPKLLSRLTSYDTTLVLEEYRLIYYGFVFQDNYSPYSDDKSKEINAAFEKQDFDEVVKICDKVVIKNPVSLKTYYNKLIALSKLKDISGQFQQLRKVYSGLLSAIISSGDGLTCKTAFKVISVSDEYEIMYKYFEIEKVKSQSLETPCDKITIKPSKTFGNENIYFDVTESFLSMEKMFNKEK